MLKNFPGVPRRGACVALEVAHGDFDPYLELPHLRVFVARPEHLLAMKCASMRL